MTIPVYATHMDHALISTAFLLVTYLAALAGIRLRSVLPESHLSKESKDSIKVSVGLIATMSALVLGLITASAKSSFDNVDAAVKHAAAQVMSLDRLLARYGTETKPIRNGLQHALQYRISTIWGADSSGGKAVDPMVTGIGFRAEELGDAIRGLTPDTESKKSIQSRAADLAEEILEGRWAIFAVNASSVSTPFLLILLFWLSITFMSFGLFAPKNSTVLVAFFICALSVASAMLLILELDSPFDGLLRISPEPMQFVLSHLNR